MERYLFISLTLALTAYGQLIMKSRALSVSSLLGVDDKLRYLTAMFTDPLVLSSLAAAVIAAVCWMLALERTDIGFCLSLYGTGVSYWCPRLPAVLFKEPISMFQMIGLTMIVIGVLINALLR